MNKPTLEHAAQQIAEATSKPPFLYDLGPEDARKVLDDIQAAPVPKLDVHEKWITVSASVGDVQVRIVKPVGAAGPLPTILYVHGGGWILGNAGTHDRLVRELAVGVNAAIAFVEYDRSPEAQYPWPSSRLTQPHNGSPGRARARVSTDLASPSSGTLSAAT